MDTWPILCTIQSFYDNIIDHKPYYSGICIYFNCQFGCDFFSQKDSIFYFHNKVFTSGRIRILWNKGFYY